MNMQSQELLSRGLFVAADPDQLALLAQALQVDPACLVPAGDGDFEAFLPDRRNGAVHRPVKGDFNYHVEVYLWRWSVDQLDAALREISTHGLVLEMPNEASDSYFGSFLFANGHRYDGEVYEDDLLDEVTILKPEVLRPHPVGEA